jgi:uncharacterized protein (TIGR04141 family)
MRTINVRLLREGRTIEGAFTDNFAPGAERALQEKPWNEIEGARLFVGQIYSNPPGWRTFLHAGSADIPGRLSSSGAGAIIFIPVDNRIAAVCFGHVHIALNDDAFERQFGLKVTLRGLWDFHFAVLVGPRTWTAPKRLGGWLYRQPPSRSLIGSGFAAALSLVA